MSFVDDAELIKLSTPRPQRLLTILDRAQAMWPWIAVLAVIPGLYAVAQRELTESDAFWGARALALSTGATFSEAVGASGDGSQLQVSAQPPLGSYLTAWAMRLMSPQHPISLVVVSYIAFGGLVIGFFLTIRRLTNDRFALLSTLLFVTHGPLLQTTQHPIPISIGLQFGFFSMWLYLRHDQSSDGFVSWSLIASGCLLGLCMLSAGPMAWLFLAMTGIKLVVDFWLAPDPRRKFADTFSRVGAILILALCAAAFGGWWSVKLISEEGAESLVQWLRGSMESGILIDAQDVSTGEFRTWIKQCLLQFTALPGLIVLGLYVSIRDLLDSRSERRSSAGLLLSCFTTALVGWCLLAVVIQTRTFWLEATRQLTLICGITLATIGIEEILSRRAKPLQVAVISCLTLLCLHFDSVQLGDLTFPQRAVVLILGLLVLGLVRTRLPATRIIEDQWLRIVLTTLLMFTVFANILAGIAYVKPDSQSIKMMYAQLRAIPPIDECVLVTESPTPRRLLFALRTFTPSLEPSIRLNSSDLRELLVARLQQSDFGPSETEPLELGETHPPHAPAIHLLVAFYGQQRPPEFRMNGVVIERRCEAIPLDGLSLFVLVVRLESRAP